MITEMILGTESAEALLHGCAARADSFPATAVIKGVKVRLFAFETAGRVSDRAIQVLGGEAIVDVVLWKDCSEMHAR
jgi:alkylation response protein AidB-like acyl-CoA dehydrogenase